MFCCLLLSPAVSDQNLPDKHPIGHNPLVCCRSCHSWVGLGQDSLVGRIGSGVRVSVSFQQKYPPGSVLRCPTVAENGVMIKGGLTSLRLRRIIGLRRACHKHFVVVLCEQRKSDAAVSARRLLPFVAALFFTLRDSYG